MVFTLQYHIHQEYVLAYICLATAVYYTKTKFRPGSTFLPDKPVYWYLAVLTDCFYVEHRCSELMLHFIAYYFDLSLVREEFVF